MRSTFESPNSSPSRFGPNRFFRAAIVRWNADRSSPADTVWPLGMDRNRSEDSRMSATADRSDMPRSRRASQ